LAGKLELTCIKASNVKVKTAIKIPKIRANPLFRFIESSNRESETIKNPNMMIIRKCRIAAQSNIKL
jgi:hypothetical protein